MRKSIFVLALLAAPSLASALFVQAPTLAIQVDRPIAKVGPTLYGLMTEEIDFSYDV
jgi:alpha-N-arabinofuranosidase